MNILTNMIGVAALSCFSIRVLLQWFLSEKQRKVVTPSPYWVFSLIGCYLYFTYGWLKSDIAILAGQFMSVFIYIWNLKMKRVWDKIPVFIRPLLYFIPLMALLYIIAHLSGFREAFVYDQNLPQWMLIVGLVGNVLFSSRFLYQWYYSYRHRRSELSTGFWIISFIGSLLIICYGSYREDWIQVLGQFNIIATIRNLILIKNNHENKVCTS